MAYVKQTWENNPATSSPLSAARLNQLETQYDQALAEVPAAVSRALTTNTVIVDTVAAAVTSANIPGKVAAEAQPYVTAAQDAAAAAVAPTDQALVALDANPASAIRVAQDLRLSATFVAPEDIQHDGPLGNKLSKVGVIIDVGATNAYDGLRTESLTTIIAPDVGRIAGVYTAYGNNTGVERASIGLAWSDDGVTWTKAGQTLAATLVAGDPDEGGLTGPVLIYDGGLYYLFYIGLTTSGYEGGTKTLCVATSPSLAAPVWTRRGTVMVPGGTGWRSVAIWHPSIIKVGALWYCFINASGAPGALERIGYATATNLLGPWTFDDVNSPLINVVANDFIAGDPAVTPMQGGYRMDFFRANDLGASDFYATTTNSDFPLGWRLGSGGAAILSPSETYDAKYAHKPFIMKYGGRVFHYYTAVSAAGSRRVALAVEPPLKVAPDFSSAPSVIGGNVSSLEAALEALGLTVRRTVSDTFNRADGSLGSSDVGSKTWQTSGGAGWGILSGVARWTGSADGAALLNTGLGDNYEIKCTVTAITGGYPFALIVRGRSSSVYLKLFRNQGGEAWVLGTQGILSPALVVGDIVRLAVSGYNYTLRVNDVQVAQWTNFTESWSVVDESTDTYQGILGSGAAPLSVDNFSVTPVA